MGFEHYITSIFKSDHEITDSSVTKIKYPNVVHWIFNDGLLTSCLLVNMKEEILCTILGGDTTYFILNSLLAQQLPNIDGGIKTSVRSIDLYVIRFFLRNVIRFLLSGY